MRSRPVRMFSPTVAQKASASIDVLPERVVLAHDEEGAHVSVPVVLAVRISVPDSAPRVCGRTGWSHRV